MSGPSRPDVTVIMLAYGSEPWLAQAIQAVLASDGVVVEMVLVDNGCDRGDLAALSADPRVRLLRPDRNLGFAGGVNHGAAAATSPVLALVNSDAIVEPDCLARLVARASEPDAGVVGGLVLLAEDPERVNSAGNPMQVLGLSWAGRMGESVTAIPAVAEVASASGACLVLRRELWDRLGGFPEEFFAYLEDLELCWRTWQLGLPVEVHAAAQARHYYEFSRNPRKMYLLERNRLLVLLTCHERRTLLVLAPALAAFEVAVTALAWRQGWGRQKIASWVWVVRHRGWVRSRRAIVQAARVMPDTALLRLMTTSVDPAIALPAVTAPLERALSIYWRVARRLVRAGRPTPPIRPDARGEAPHVH